MLVLSVTATFVAFVAVVALVAVDAFPVKAPTKVVDVTEVKPANVVTVAPKATAVEPIVTLEFTKAAFGMLVNEAPEPLNPVAVKTPVEGLNWYLVEATYSVVRLPAVVAANKAVVDPKTTIRLRTSGAYSKRKEHRIIKKTPAVTIVAAWISAETGVGPSIASGNQECKPNCADLPTAPKKRHKQIKLIIDILK